MWFFLKNFDKHIVLVGFGIVKHGLDCLAVVVGNAFKSEDSFKFVSANLVGFAVAVFEVAVQTADRFIGFTEFLQIQFKIADEILAFVRPADDCVGKFDFVCLVDVDVFAHNCDFFLFCSLHLGNVVSVGRFSPHYNWISCMCGKFDVVFFNLTPP